MSVNKLNFKWGLHGGLENATKVPGTIYVTTDEKAMYVDIDENNRIRLGQIISLTYAEFEKSKPPFSTEAFYYITDINALVKWTGTTWTQINSTQDIKNILGFKGTVYNKADLQTVDAYIGDIYTVIDEEKGTTTNYVLEDIPEKSDKVWIEIDSYGKNYLEFQKLKTDLNDARLDLQGQIDAIIGTEGDIGSLKSLGDSIEDLKKFTSLAGKVTDVENIPDSANAGDVYIVENETSGTRYWLVLGKGEDGKIQKMNISSIGSVLIENNNRINGISTQITTINGDIANIEEQIKEINETTIPGVDDRIDLVLEYVKQLTGFVNELNTVDDLPTSGEVGDIYIIGDNLYIYNEDKNEDGKPDWVTISNFAKSYIDIQEDISDLNTDLLGAKGDISTLAQNLSMLGLASTGAFSFIGKIEDFTGNLQEYDIGIDSKGNVQVYVENSEGNLGWSSNTTVIKALDEKLKVDQEKIEDIEEDLTQVKADISSILELEKAADALVYKGTIRQEGEDVLGLPTLGVKVGFTYKATTDIDKTKINGLEPPFEEDNPSADPFIRIGDLLIATGEENEETGFIKEGELIWTHIPSGYYAEYVPELKIAEVANSNSARVNLFSAHSDKTGEGDLGKFLISGQAETPITVTVNANSEIQIGMEWGTF